MANKAEPAIPTLAATSLMPTFIVNFKKMKRFYIIGNGFDLHHGLKTSYYDFAQYLEKSNNELFTTLEKYISYPTNQHSLWSDFETNLANLSIDEILDDNIIYLPDIMSDEFRDRDLHAFPNVMENFFRLLTEELFQEFQDFIQLVDFQESASSKMVELDIQATFLTFNYTNTLEKLYGVKRNKVTYIHNSAFYGAESIILGHGMNPANFKQVTPEPPDNLNPEEYDRWYGENVSWDYSFDTGRETLEKYFETTFKPTEKVIKDKQYFLQAINQFDEINIFGHSLSDVDMPYFREIYKHSKLDANWRVSYYSLNNKKHHFEKMTNLGITSSKLDLFELKDIQRNNKQLKLKL
jgi:hypothetical protein